LIVQEYDKNGNLWATRGMKIYQLKKGDDKFKRIAHIPTGLSIFWLRNFTVIRKLTIRPECIEMTVTRSGDLYALSAGKMWLLRHGDKKFKKTLELSHYGFGDQGVRNDGILSVSDSAVFLGEYFQNQDRGNVRIYKTNNSLDSWTVGYEFSPGRIRHIHSIQKDPYTEKLWVCTGDTDSESMVAWSEDGFKTLQKIGDGNQIWRICQLVFTENALYWGTDNSDERISGIYKLDKITFELVKLLKIEGAIFFGTRLANGTIVMSTDREGWPNEIDDKTRLYIITNDNEITSIDAGTWDHKKPGFWFKHALLRFQRNQGGPSLVITCLNQKEFPDGELLIIAEDTLISVAGKIKASR